MPVGALEVGEMGARQPVRDDRKVDVTAEKVCQQVAGFGSEPHRRAVNYYLIAFS